MELTKLWAYRNYPSWLVRTGTMAVCWDGEFLRTEHHVEFYDGIELVQPDPAAAAAASSMVFRSLDDLEIRAIEASFLDEQLRADARTLPSRSDAYAVVDHPLARYFPVAVPHHELATLKPYREHNFTSAEPLPPWPTLEELLVEAAAQLDHRPAQVSEIAATLAETWDSDFASLLAAAITLAES